MLALLVVLVLVSVFSDHLKELVGEFGDGLQFVAGPLGPYILAVALNLGWGASAKGVLKFDVRVVFNTLVNNGCFGCDLLFLYCVCIEKVTSSIRGKFLARGPVLIHV